MQKWICTPHKDLKDSRKFKWHNSPLTIYPGGTENLYICHASNPSLELFPPTILVTQFARFQKFYLPDNLFINERISKLVVKKSCFYIYFLISTTSFEAFFMNHANQN